MRFTTCTCTDGLHDARHLGHSVFRSEADAEIIARHVGRHVTTVEFAEVAA